MSSYYNAFGGTDGPPDPNEDEERPAEGDDEPSYEDLDDATAMALDSDEYDWSDLNDEAADINIVTGEVEE